MSFRNTSLQENYKRLKDPSGFLKENFVVENAQEDAVSAEKYVDDMIKLHGDDYKTVRTAILNNLVNSEYQRVSNDYVEAVWSAMRKRFPG